MEQSSAYMLILIGLLGFFVDMLLKPISPAGLVLLLLAATPFLIALFKRSQARDDITADAAAKTPEAPAVPQRAPAARVAAAASPRAAPVASPAPRRDAEPDKTAPARARVSSEARLQEVPRQAAEKVSQPQPDQQRLPLHGRVQLQGDAEPQRRRADAAARPARKPGEPQLIHPNAL